MNGNHTFTFFIFCTYRQWDEQLHLGVETGNQGKKLVTTFASLAVELRQQTRLASERHLSSKATRTFDNQKLIGPILNNIKKRKAQIKI